MSKKYNVYFIQPPIPGNKKISRNSDCGSESKANYMWQPYDFLLLTSRFDPNLFNINFIDGVADRIDQEKLISSITNPDLCIIGFADAVWESDYHFLKLMRKSFTDCLFFCLGDAFLEECNVESALAYSDGIIRTPLFFDPLNFINKSKEKTQEEFKNDKAFKLLDCKSPTSVTGFMPRHDLFSKSFYRWPVARHKKYTTIHTAWGCPYSCSYCPVSRTNFITRPNDEILIELKFVKELGFKEIYVGDKSFGVPLEKTKKLLNEIISHQFNFSWSVYLHPNQFNEELISLMSRAGCHTIILGIESLVKQNLRTYNRSLRNDSYQEIIDICHKYNVSVCADFIFGLKDEDYQDCLKSINFSVESGLDFASFYILSPLPGTSVRRELIENKTILSNSHHFNLASKESIVSSNMLTSKELEKIRKLAVRKFYLRPTYLIRKLCSVKSFEHFLIQAEEMFQLFYKTIK